MANMPQNLIFSTSKHHILQTVLSAELQKYLSWLLKHENVLGLHFMSGYMPSYDALLMIIIWWINAVQMNRICTNIYFKQNDFLFVDYCDVFTSGLDSHSDGTHSL